MLLLSSSWSASQDKRVSFHISETCCLKTVLQDEEKEKWCPSLTSIKEHDVIKICLDNYSPPHLFFLLISNTFTKILSLMLNFKLLINTYFSFIELFVQLNLLIKTKSLHFWMQNVSFTSFSIYFSMLLNISPFHTFIYNHVLDASCQKLIMTYLASWETYIYLL